MDLKKLDQVLINNKDIVKAHNFATFNLGLTKSASITQTSFGDFARINNPNVNIYAVQPDVFEACLSDFLSVKWQSPSKLSLGEQLYTPRGSQGFGTG